MKGKRMKKVGSVLLLLALITSMPHQSVYAAASPLISPEHAEVPLEAVVTKKPTYVVRTSPFLELVWNAKNKDYEGTYRVGVCGSVGPDEIIRVSPAETFIMTSDLGTQTGTISQPVTRWAMKATESGMLSMSEKTFAETTGTARIKLPGTAVYRGGITFTFSVE